MAFHLCIANFLPLLALHHTRRFLSHPHTGQPSLGELRGSSIGVDSSCLENTSICEELRLKWKRVLGTRNGTTNTHHRHESSLVESSSPRRCCHFVGLRNETNPGTHQISPRILFTSRRRMSARLPFEMEAFDRYCKTSFTSTNTLSTYTVCVFPGDTRQTKRHVYWRTEFIKPSSNAINHILGRHATFQRCS